MPMAAKHLSWRSIILRLVMLVSALVFLNLGVSAVINRMSLTLASSGFLLNAFLVFVWLAYVLLLAVPFVPGTEVGVSLLVAHGAQAAPFVYLGTISGLMLAFFMGTALSSKIASRLFERVGLKKTSAFIKGTGYLDQRQRLKRMQAALPVWAVRTVVGHPSLVLAALLNLPGNSVIGGGGGIAVLSGAGGVFGPLRFFLTIALATAPVPILVYVFGAGLLG